MSCELGKELRKNEKSCRELAKTHFEEDRNSFLGLAHSQAAIAYHRVLETHIRMGCAWCGSIYDKSFKAEMALKKGAA